MKLKEKQMLEQQRKRQLVNNNNERVCHMNGHKLDSDTVKYEIFRAMEQQGSLLEILTQKRPSDPMTSANSAPVSPINSHTVHKIPVCDKTTIEELKLTNQQLKLLVEQLLNELENEKTQNMVLRKEISSLKEELTSDRDTKSLPIYLDDSLETPKLLY